MCYYFYCFTAHTVIRNISTVSSWSSLLTVFWLDILVRTVSSGLGYGLNLLSNPFIRFTIPRCISSDSNFCCGPVNTHYLLQKLEYLLFIYLLIHSLCNTLIHSWTSVFIPETFSDCLPIHSKGNDESTQIRCWIGLQKCLLNLLLPQPWGWGHCTSLQHLLSGRPTNLGVFRTSLFLPFPTLMLSANILGL